MAQLGIGVAALGRPAYITIGRDDDLGPVRDVAALRERTFATLDAAWDAGLRFVDTARSYGLGESFVGAWLHAHPSRRAAVTVESKWGYRYVGDWRMDAGVHEVKDHAPAALDEQWPATLAALGGAPDRYLIHSVTPESPAFGDAALLDRLRALAADGVRVGFSTSGPRQGEVVDAALALADSPFSVVQSTWNLLERSAAPALARANDAGWLVVVKEALANGRLGPRGDLAPRLADGARGADAVALAAALAQPWADVVLSGAVSPAQLRENLDALAVPAAVVADAAAAIEPEAPEAYWRTRSALAWG